MPYTEAKEHAPGRLHAIFAQPYSAFEQGLHLYTFFKVYHRLI